LLMANVNGCNRVPEPPASIIPFMNAKVCDAIESVQVQC
jgi:hypothetical protein